MINEHDAMRICDDAAIARDALQSLVVAAPYIHENYLKQKLKVVKNCIKFMEQFEPVEDES